MKNKLEVELNRLTMYNKFYAVEIQQLTYEIIKKQCELMKLEKKRDMLCDELTKNKDVVNKIKELVGGL